MTDQTTTPEPESDAAICRRNGWTVGTQLVGDEGYGPSTIRITAVGERCILAVRTAPRLESEGTWNLSCRDWRKVEDDETNTPEPAREAHEPAPVLAGALAHIEYLQGRITGLEADVRALGGDPDRMVDPRDHETAVLALHVEMRAAADNWDRVVLNDACAVAERHMLRMAQASLGAGALAVREVPAGEAREGDMVTDTRRGRIVRLPGDRNAMVRWDGNSGVQEVDLDWSRITVSRPVSPLPDQPGAVGTATVRGVKGVTVFRTDDDNGPMHWTSAVLVNGQRWFEDEDVTDFLPAGAGVDEGAKR